MNISYDLSYLIIASIAIVAIIACCIIWYWLRTTIRRERRDAPGHHLSRHRHNPVMSPRAHQEWEQHGTFNPAAVEDAEGHVHLLYRAIGSDGLSTIGHASSADGVTFDHRSSFPVYRPHIDERLVSDPRPDNLKQYNPGLYSSGGGWGGHEDPRAVKIGDRIYMTYTAFQGWSSVRIAITSIAEEDLRKGRWNWRKPRFLSPPGYVNKNWVLFPEKINGKYAILHGITPKIMIDYIDDIEHFRGHIHSKRPEGVQPGRADFWDNRIRGAGAPPIKTDVGWLLLYHAIDEKEWSRYKLGAMILDPRDPSRVLYRSPQPILMPDMPYENDGKPGIIYASGALVRNGDLVIYYGGGDRHTCVARTPLESLLRWLTTYGEQPTTVSA